MMKKKAFLLFNYIRVDYCMCIGGCLPAISINSIKKRIS